MKNCQNDGDPFAKIPISDLDQAFKEEISYEQETLNLNQMSQFCTNNQISQGQYIENINKTAYFEFTKNKNECQSEISLRNKANFYLQRDLQQKKINTNFSFNLVINQRKQFTNISISQTQRRYLFNLISKNKNRQLDDKLTNLVCKQFHLLIPKDLLNSQLSGDQKMLEVKNKILLKNINSNQNVVNLINQQQTSQQEESVNNLSGQPNKINCAFVNFNLLKIYQRSRKLEESLFQDKKKFQSDKKINSFKDEICLKLFQLDRKATQKCSKIFNRINNKNQNLLNVQQIKILGGGGICGSKEKAYSSQPICYKQQQELQQNITQVENQQQQQTEKIKEKHNQYLGNELERFKKQYEECFGINNLNENEIENQVKFIIKRILYPLNDYICAQEIRDKVVDMINLLINYLLIIIISKSQNSTEKQIFKLNKKLQGLRLYCEENQERFPCLNIYQYCDILINLNSQRLRLQEVNLGSDSTNLAQRVIQVVKYGAGFVTITGAIKNLSKNDLEKTNNLKNEIKQIFCEKLTQGGIMNAYLDNNKNNLAKNIYALYLKKVNAIGDQFLQFDHIAEIIFYLEEVINIKDNDTLLFTYMQLNYLLSKQQNYDGFKGFLQRLEKENKIDLIIKQENLVQIRKSSDQSAEMLKNMANLIAQYNSFRFIRAELLLHFAYILKVSNRNEKQFQSVMTTVVSNYFQEKQKAVKIVYEEDSIMRDFINKSLDKSKILAEINQSKQQMQKMLDHKQQYNQFAYDINNDRDLDVHLTNYSIIAWVQNIKQRNEELYLNKKDELLTEVNNLYVNQQITYQDGYKINTDEKDALQQIINQFLVPNFVISSDENQQQQKLNQLVVKNYNQPNNINSFQQGLNDIKNITSSPCKIISIFAEGGYGKSTLLKKLEIELLQRKSYYTKNNKSDFIPFIIKCNSLDRQKPSIEDYLESQNIDRHFIDILKKSERNKLIMLDGFDEYTGEYFNVYQKLKLNEWVNTLVIVTSRLEKIAVTDAQVYFNYYDQYRNQGKNDSFAVFKLEKFTESDIFDYLEKFEKQKSLQKDFQQNDKLKELTQTFKNLIELLKIPINLYFLTRMTKEINLNDESVYFAFQEISDQTEIFELFFQYHFNKESQLFIESQKYLNLNENQKHKMIEKMQTLYFEYFQQIAMHIFILKGQKSNYLSMAKSSIKFQIRDQIQAFFQKYQIKTEEIIQQLNSYADPRVIKINCFNIQDNNNKKELPAQSKTQNNQHEFEFKYKSLYEYFVARAMKYDFDLHKEDIFKLDIEQLKQFNINKKVIINYQTNTSEQQILLNLYKLIKPNLDSLSFKYTYAYQDISQTNRYVQFLKKSKISKHNEKSQIDTGASNLLSALFNSKFLFVNLVFSKCSFSQAYLSSKKLIKFQDCNLGNAFISKQNLEYCETSNTKNAILGAFEKIFDTKDIYQFNKVIFYKETLISITRTGFINQFELVENNHLSCCKILKSNQITTVPLRGIHFVKGKNLFIIRGRKSLFEVDSETLERISSYTFQYDITSLSVNNLKYIVTLDKKQVFFGDVQNGFTLLDQNKIQSEYSLSLKDLIFTYLNGSINIYSLQNLLIIKSIQNCFVDLNISCFSPDGKYLVTAGLKDNYCRIWNVEQGFQLVTNIQGHTDTILSVAYSSDGKYIATGSRDKTCKVWNAEKGFELINTIQGHTQSLISVAFSEDGKYLATSSHDQNCKIYNTQKGFELKNAIQGHTQGIFSIAFSPDGKYLATGSGDNTCKILSAGKNIQLLTSLQGHNYQINSVAFSADSRYLATGSFDSTCKIWNIERGFQLINTIQDQSQINSVAFSPDGKYLVTGSRDRTCKIWSVERGFQLLNTLQGHSQEIKSVAFSGDGQLLATVSCDNTCKIWNAQQGFYLVNNIQGHTQPITSVAFSVDGKYLATSSEDKTCKIWNLLQNCQLLKIIEGHASRINQVTFSADGNYLATCSEDKTCKIWNTQKGFSLTNSFEGHVSEVISAAFSPDSKYLATGSSDKTCKVWCIEKLYGLTNSIQEHSLDINQVTFSQDCKYLAACLDDKTCKIWNAHKGFDFLTTIKGHSQTITSAAFSADGKYLATGSFDSTCKIWNVHKGFELFKTIEGEIHQITALAFSLNGIYLAVGSYVACKILNVEKEFEVTTKIQENTEKINSVAFSADSKYFATGSNDKTCKIYFAEKYFQLASTIQGHSSFVNSVAFSTDGRYLATGSQDNTCKIWNMKQGFELLITLTGHAFEINSVAFSPDSNFLATGSYDKTCKIWSVNQGFQLIKNIEAHTWIISSLVFSADGKYLVTGSRDKTCKIWNLEKGFDLVNNNQYNNIHSTSPQYGMVQNQNNIVQFNTADRIFEQQYDL